MEHHYRGGQLQSRRVDQSFVGCVSWCVVEVGFEIGERGPHTAAAAHGDLCGGDGWHGPSGSEECRQFLRARRQQLDGLEPRLEPLGEQIELQVARAKERAARRQSVKVGEQQVLRFTRAPIQLINDLDRP